MLLMVITERMATTESIQCTAIEACTKSFLGLIVRNVNKEDSTSLGYDVVKRQRDSCLRVDLQAL